MSAKKGKTGYNWEGKINFILPDRGRNRPFDVNEIPERYKDVFLENICYATKYKCPLSSNQLTQLFFFHSFIVFRTASYYWSVEKNSKGIIIQMFTTEYEVKLITSEGELRNKNYEKVKIMESINVHSINVESLIYYIMKNELHLKYNYLKSNSNCKGFANRTFNLIRSGYQIPKWNSMWIFNVVFYLKYKESINRALCEIDNIINFNENISHVWMYAIPLNEGSFNDHYYVVFSTTLYKWSVEKTTRGIIIQIFRNVETILPQRNSIRRGFNPRSIFSSETYIKVSRLLDYICEEELNNNRDTRDFADHVYSIISTRILR